MISWFKKRRREAIVMPALRGTRLESSIDAAGFDFAAVIDRSRAQASVGLVATERSVDLGRLHQWESHLSSASGLVAAESVLEAGPHPGPARLWATFRASTKSARRDPQAFVAELARRGDELYGAAADAGIESVPMDVEEVTRAVATAWSPTQAPTWPPVAGELVETTKSVVVDGEAYIALEMDTSFPEVEAEMVDAMAAIEIGPRVRWVRVFRPPAVEDGQGRRSSVLVVSMSADVERVESVVAMIVEAFSARVRLRTHRLVGRQGVGVAMAAGAGVLGWQHTALTMREAA